MEFIYYIFQTYAATRNVVNVYDNLSEWVIETIQEWTSRAPKDLVDKHARKLTSVGVNDVRKLAAKAFAESGRTDIPRDEQEALIRLLTNLARNVQIRSAVGSMDSNLIRGGQLASLLNVVVEPVRHCGEPVTRGSGWTLTRHLGSGSFGEVWHAVNPDFPSPRAYKFFTDGNAVEWLRREQAGLVAIFRRLGGHPHVVKFEDAQASQCDHPYLAFEYLGGGSLHDWILRPREVRGVLEPAEVIRELVAGLAAAHSKGIAHRDIKPANILLTDGPDARVKIGDFGLARVGSAGRDGTWQQMSYSGFAGTPLYSPPESQHQGPRRNPFQDDVFAVGIVWYQMLIGRIERPPYDFAERLQRQGADPHTIGLVERCLAHPDRRFADARAVEGELKEGPPVVRPCPPGVPDVQYLARDYLAALMR